MITALNIQATKDYVYSKDKHTPDGKPLDDATVWHLGAMDSYIEAHLATKGTSYEFNNPNGDDLTDMKPEQLVQYYRTNIDVQLMAYEAFRLCCKGWENFSVKYETRGVTIKGRTYKAIPSDIVARIPKDVIMEIYGEIQKLSSLTADELKN